MPAELLKTVLALAAIHRRSSLCAWFAWYSHRRSPNTVLFEQEITTSIAKVVHHETTKTSRSLRPQHDRIYKHPCVIYFIAAGTPPVAIKIGMAAVTGNRDLRATITRRLSQIQSSNHERISLLGVIQFTHDTHGQHPTWDADAKERELHTEFDRLRLFAP
jgi:hypothetical protein